MQLTDEELDAYERGRAAEMAVADGTGDEDAADHWMGVADQAAR
ncbi:hypothetical protein [Actinacidiphila acididurans]|nr:hypothetical protein [Actinacidiphila acididurans]